MIDAVMLWNEPNNKSHWDFLVDEDWSIFARMTCLAAQAVRSESRSLPRVLGGISPIDPLFIENMKSKGVLDVLEAVAVHGFPLGRSARALHGTAARHPRVCRLLCRDDPPLRILSTTEHPPRVGVDP